MIQKSNTTTCCGKETLNTTDGGSKYQALHLVVQITLNKQELILLHAPLGHMLRTQIQSTWNTKTLLTQVHTFK